MSYNNPATVCVSHSGTIEAATRELLPTSKFSNVAMLKGAFPLVITGTVYITTYDDKDDDKMMMTMMMMMINTQQIFFFSYACHEP